MAPFEFKGLIEACKIINCSPVWQLTISLAPKFKLEFIAIILAELPIFS